MSFTSGIPATGQSLNQTRNPIRDNFTNYNNVLSQDHVAPNSAGQGKHNKVTQPAFVANPVTGQPPVTAAGEPTLYAFQPSANVGVIEYSMPGGNTNVVPFDFTPSPVTSRHSNLALFNLGAGGFVNILDFTGLTTAIALFTASDTPSVTQVCTFVFWTGGTLTIKNIFTVFPTLVPSVVGPILRLTSPGGTNGIFWTLQFLRVN